MHIIINANAVEILIHQSTWPFPLTHTHPLACHLMCGNGIVMCLLLVRPNNIHLLKIKYLAAGRKSPVISLLWLVTIMCMNNRCSAREQGDIYTHISTRTHTHSHTEYLLCCSVHYMTIQRQGPDKSLLPGNVLYIVHGS